VRRRDVEAQLLHQAGESGRLALGQGEHETRKRGRVDDRVLERALQAATDEPCVECVVAVLDQDRPLGEAQKRAARVLELGRSDEHRAIDVVAPARVRVDRRAAVDERVEKRKCAVELESLRPDLEDQEGRVARRLDVQGDELRLGQRGMRPDLGGIDRDLFPGHRLCRAAGLQEKRLVGHRASARARRAQAISSPLRARRSRTKAT
jgi:hypothetical protein